MAKRLALVQADTWTKRGAAGDIYELEPLVVVEETSKRSAIGKLVNELAQQGHLLIRHNRRLKCRACNMYRADRQSSFWNRIPCVPRPCAAEVISQMRNKERQHNESFEKESYPYTSSVSQDIQGTHSHMDRFSLSLCPPSQVGEQCDGSRYVSARSHLRGMDGKSRKFDSVKSVVNTPIGVAGPRAPLRSNLDDPEDWELPCSVGESVCWDEAHRTEPVACRSTIKCGTTGCTRSCPTSVEECWHTAGKKPATRRTCQTSYMPKVTGKKETVGTFWRCCERSCTGGHMGPLGARRAGRDRLFSYVLCRWKSVLGLSAQKCDKHA